MNTSVNTTRFFTATALRRGDSEGSPRRKDGVLIAAIDSSARARENVRACAFDVVDDTSRYLYSATINGHEIAKIPYVTAGQRRALLGTVVVPGLRGDGFATEFVSRVLNAIRAEGKTVTVECSVIAAFLGHYPHYSDVVDETYPGSAIGGAQPGGG